MHFGLWLAAAALLAIVEILSVDFVFLMIAGGALAGAIASLFGAPLTVQVICFALVSVLMLILVRPWIKTHLARSTPNIRTNAQALVGASAVVVEDVTSSDGRVKLKGEVWSAKSDNFHRWTVGQSVSVLRVEGATVIVGPGTFQP